ncbi:MAG: HNH endonuclease [Trebonia sp.]
MRHEAENAAAKERKSLWHLANRDRRLADQQAAQTPEARAEAAARTRQWRKDNPDKVAANRKAWAKANPEKVAAKTQRRLARQRSMPADLVTVTELLAEQTFRCHICGNVIDPGCKYPDAECPTIDHIIPLSRGGSGLRSNLKAAHMRCNSAKGVKVMQP